MKILAIATAVAAGLALSSGTASAWWGAGPNDYCSARTAQVYELPVGAGAALVASYGALDPLGPNYAVARIARDPVLRAAVAARNVPMAAVVDVQFYRDCSAVIFTY